MARLPLFTPSRPGYGSFNLRDLRRQAVVLPLMGAAELLLFCGLAIKNFYWGSRTISLLVSAYLAVPPGQPRLSRFIHSSAGLYATGSTGRLLYHATSLLDYALFFSIGDFGFLDAVFFFGSFCYLYLAMRRLRPGREFSASISSAFSRIGLGCCCMFVVKLWFTTYVALFFAAKTQHQFDLAPSGSSLYYALLGSIISLSATFFQRGQQLQRESELTI